MDKTDPICGKQGTIKAHGYYFCSKECIKAYEEKYIITKEKDYIAVNVPTEMEVKLQEKHGINKKRGYTSVTKSEKWYREKTLLFIIGLIIIYSINLILNYAGIKILDDLIFSFYDFVKRIWLSLLIGLIITLILATIMEVLAEGTAPLAFEIFKQTGAFGNSFIFLMTGVATDYTEIGLIWDNIGKKVAIWLPIITVPQILILGYLFNNFFK